MESDKTELQPHATKQQREASRRSKEKQPISQNLDNLTVDHLNKESEADAPVPSLGRGCRMKKSNVRLSGYDLCIKGSKGVERCNLSASVATRESSDSKIVSIHGYKKASNRKTADEEAVGATIDPIHLVGSTEAESNKDGREDGEEEAAEKGGEEDEDEKEEEEESSGEDEESEEEDGEEDDDQADDQVQEEVADHDPGVRVLLHDTAGGEGVEVGRVDVNRCANWIDLACHL